ncbi:putative DYNACTIN [Sesbania bispinosa]|nr:putative DYNACTIN [Sesbania bispinosa]
MENLNWRKKREKEKGNYHHMLPSQAAMSGRTSPPRSPSRTFTSVAAAPSSGESQVASHRSFPPCSLHTTVRSGHRRAAPTVTLLPCGRAHGRLCPSHGPPLQPNVVRGRPSLAGGQPPPLWLHGRTIMRLPLSHPLILPFPK